MHSRVARSLGTFQHSLLPKKMNYNTALVFPDTAKMFRNIPCIACTSLRKSPSVFERSSISVTALNIQRGQWLQISCHLRARQNLHHDHQSHHYRWLMTAATTLAHGKTQGSWSRRWTLSFRGSHHHHHIHRHRHCHHHGCIHPHHLLFLICAPPSPDQLQLPCGTTDLLFAFSQSDSLIKWPNWDWDIIEKISSLIIHCIISNFGVYLNQNCSSQT